MDGTRGQAVRAGVWVGQVDPAEAREHLRRYVAAAGKYGSMRGASRESGASLSAVKELFAGRTETITADTYAKIMALEIPELRVPPARHTYPHGTRRRVHAMVMIGVPLVWLADFAGTARRLQEYARAEFVQVGTADKIRVAVDKLVADPDGRPYDARAITYAMRRTCVECVEAHLGHHTLDWWWDIDDPFDIPDPAPPASEDVDPVLVDNMIAGTAAAWKPDCYDQRRHYHRCDTCERWKANRDQAIAKGTRAGVSTAALAARLGESTRSIERARAELVDQIGMAA